MTTDSKATGFESARPHNRPGASPSPERECLRILLVDDEIWVGRLLKRILERQGWQVQLIKDGHAAIVAEPHHGAFDVIILDIKIPGLDGHQVYRILRERWPQVRFLFITGYPDEDAWEEIETENLPRMLKPFWPQELIDAVRDLAEPSSED